MERFIHQVLPVIISVIVIIVVAILRSTSRPLAAILSTMPLTIPLSLWVVYAGVGGDRRAMTEFARAQPGNPANGRFHVCRMAGGASRLAPCPYVVGRLCSVGDRPGGHVAHPPPADGRVRACEHGPVAWHSQMGATYDHD